MRVLGIETSCDETAAAVVDDGRHIGSNIVASQVEVHARYGGVVPEVASRQHMLQMIPVVERALSEAGGRWDDIDAVAVTCGPGLVGSLMVGVNMAKAIAFARGMPLYGINHLEGHIYTAWLEREEPGRYPGFPLVCLVASGGHTDLLLMRGHGDYTRLGMTRDDAAGESFDKAARVLRLSYPGGPAIQKASEGLEDAPPEERLPRAWLKGSLDFSFSGLKTALLHKARESGVSYDSPGSEAPPQPVVERLAAAFQESVVDVLATKTVDAAKQHGAKGVILGGGVTANRLLRRRITSLANDLPVFIPSPRLCVDNGAMIAACAYFNAQRGPAAGLDLDVVPALKLG